MMFISLGLLAVGLQVQDGLPEAGPQARKRATEMRAECAAALEQVEGVSTVGVGGSGSDYRLLIVVRDPVTQRYVRDLIGGDDYGGVRILWSISAPSPAPGAAPAPPPGAPP